MTTIVTSPAGESVEVVPDDEWLQLTDTHPKALQLQNARRTVIGTLWTHGAFRDAKGYAVQPLHQAMVERGYQGSQSAINGVLREPVMAPAVHRVIRGRRTDVVQLVAMPQRWLDVMHRDFPPEATNGHRAPEQEAVATPEPVPEETPKPEPMPPAAMDHPLELQVSSTVAMALLTQVVEIISTGQPHATNEVRRLERDLAEVQQRLSERLAENERHRRTIRELQDEVMAARQERDGLRQRLHMAEANLAKATSQDTQRLINERVHQELAKVMRAAPSGTHGRDEA